MFGRQYRSSISTARRRSARRRSRPSRSHDLTFGVRTGPDRDPYRPDSTWPPCELMNIVMSSDDSTASARARPVTLAASR